MKFVKIRDLLKLVLRRQASFLSNAQRRGVRAQLITDAEGQLLALRAKRLQKIEMLVLSPVARMPGKAEVLLQALLHRQLELADAFVREMNAGSFNPPFLLS